MDEGDSAKLFVDTPENDLFAFETDQLAIRGNKDYCDVLKTIVTLTAQREQAIKDFNKILEIKKKTLENPWALVKKIHSGERIDIDTPPMFQLPKLPVINFNQFDVKVPESEIAAIYAESCNEKQEDGIKHLANNSRVNNKAWSPEEQKRLEELLIRFPPEPVEMRRYEKIAKALGNRTIQQVSSRCQKYFLKLYKAGLPIPGRVPKAQEKHRKSYLHKHHRNNHYLHKPTTFFPDLCVPVVMNDCDDSPGPTIPMASSASSSSNYLFQSDYHKAANIQVNKTDDQMKLELLKRVKAEKLREQEGASSLYQHKGFKCDHCDSDPIVGSRWHCLTCKESVDYCTDCVLSQLYSSEPHPLQHLLVLFNDSEISETVASDSESHTSNNIAKGDENDSSDSGESEDIRNRDVCGATRENNQNDNHDADIGFCFNDPIDENN